MFTVYSTLIWAVLTGQTDWVCYIGTLTLCVEAVAQSCIIATWWSGSGGIQAWSWRLTGFVQCFDTVGLVIRPVKIVHEITYYVSSGTLNPTHSHSLHFYTGFTRRLTFSFIYLKHSCTSTTSWWLQGDLHFPKGLTVFSQNQCQARNSLIGVWGRVFARQEPRRLKFKHSMLVMPHCPLTTKNHVLVLLALIPLSAVSCVAACWSSVSD